jgi:hypothetical protein
MCVLAAAGMTPGAGARPSSGGAARASAGTPAAVTVDVHRRGPVIPADFLGLSIEVKNLPQLGGFARRGDLVALMRSLGQGVLRLGGVSGDKFAAWTGPGSKLPSWARSAVSVQDLRGVADLAQRTGWRVLLAVNLGHFDPQAAAQEARAARAALGDRLAGIEIGNEPDAYVAKKLRTKPWRFASYRPQMSAYRSAIEQANPGLPVAGPDVSTGVPILRWVRAAATAEHPGLLTAHYYPLSRCGGYAPVLSDLVGSGGVRGGVRPMETRYLGELARIARSTRIPLRVDETNDVSCGGQPGVSNTFAAALWALDYVMRAMQAGMTGVNFHDLIDNSRSYGPLAANTRASLSAGQLSAQPEWYALLIARRLLGDRLLGSRVSPSHPGLTARAFLSAEGHLQIVLVNFDSPGARPLRVRLRVPSTFASGTVLRLTGPSLGATGGVQLGGRKVGADGTWAPSPALRRLAGSPGAPALTLAPASAALVSLSGTDGTLGSPAGLAQRGASPPPLVYWIDRLARSVRRQVDLTLAEVTGRPR